MRNLYTRDEPDESVVAALRQLVSSKVEQEQLAAGLPGALAKAAEKSSRIMAEDLLRESGYMFASMPESLRRIYFFQ